MTRRGKDPSQITITKQDLADAMYLDIERFHYIDFSGHGQDEDDLVDELWGYLTQGEAYEPTPKEDN